MDIKNTIDLSCLHIGRFNSVVTTITKQTDTTVEINIRNNTVYPNYNNVMTIHEDGNNFIVYLKTIETKDNYPTRVEQRGQYLLSFYHFYDYNGNLIYNEKSKIWVILHKFFVLHNIILENVGNTSYSCSWRVR